MEQFILNAEGREVGRMVKEVNLSATKNTGS